MRSHWPSFTRYRTKRILAIDNNVSENALHAVALGRKNWLFAGSDRGDSAAAVLVSMMASCKLYETVYRGFVRRTEIPFGFASLNRYSVTPRSRSHASTSSSVCCQAWWG